MARPKDSRHVSLAGIFHHVQSQMLAHLASGDIFEHPTACGAVTERHWLDLFQQYLPQRYRASPAFIVDSDGRRSRQIDIAIFDRLYSPLLFPLPSGLHIPAESVYAVFEVKQMLNFRLLRDAGAKVASVRRLRRTSVPVISAGRPRPALRPPRILAGVLALRNGWNRPFQAQLRTALASLSPDESLDLGCALQTASFEAFYSPRRTLDLRLSPAGHALIFFMLRLLDRLRSLGTAPAPDLSAYARSLNNA
jgi:hypothetical protein